MRASRLLSIMLILHSRGQVSAQQLSDELEVSLRTVYRDIEALGAAGVPVYAVRGRAGGFALVDGFRTRLTGLTPDEAAAVFLAGLPGAAGDLGLGEVMTAAQLKLLAALPPELRARAERIRDRFHLDAPGWERTADSPPALGAVADAVWQQHPIEISYQRSDRAVVDRALDPLGLVLKAGVWYLVAQADGRARTYRLARVRTVAVSSRQFQRPAGWNLAAFWTSYQRDYERRLFKGEAQLRLSPAGRDLLFLVGSAAARAGHVAMGPVDADGWASTALPIESVRHATHALLQLGADVEVVGPPELRQAVAEAARATAARYDGGLDASAGGTSRELDSATVGSAGGTAG